MSDELKTCPFCMGEVGWQKRRAGWQAICGCGYSSPYNRDKAAALASHNKLSKEALVRRLTGVLLEGKSGGVPVFTKEAK